MAKRERNVFMEHSEEITLVANSKNNTLIEYHNKALSGVPQECPLWHT